MATELLPEELSLLSAFIDKRIDVIISLEQSKGLRASGESAQQLRKNLVDNIAQLIDGAGHLEFEDFGRSAGGFPPFQKLYAWLAFKKYGIDYVDDKQRRGIAFALQRKIAQRGTHTHIINRPTGVLTESLNDQSLRELMDGLVRFRANKITTDVKRIFN